MKLALVFPPACDPTAPYPAVAALAGFLRPQGIEVLPIDANLEGFLALLQREPLALLSDRIEGVVAGPGGPGGADHKTQLQELVARRFETAPSYDVVDDGPDHEKRFFATVRVGDGVVGRGEGRSKKLAEQAAAGAALAHLATTAEGVPATAPATTNAINESEQDNA